MVALCVLNSNGQKANSCHVFILFFTIILLYTINTGIIMEKHDANTSITYGNSLLKHDGIISKISSNTITVALKGNIDCEGCNAKLICGASGSNVKEIEVFDFTQSFRLNENVVVALQKQLGLKAVFWAYIFPFILMLST